LPSSRDGAAAAGWCAATGSVARRLPGAWRARAFLRMGERSRERRGGSGCIRNSLGRRRRTSVCRSSRALCCSHASVGCSSGFGGGASGRHYTVPIRRGTDGYYSRPDRARCGRHWHGTWTVGTCAAPQTVRIRRAQRLQVRHRSCADWILIEAAPAGRRLAGTLSRRHSEADSLSA
jgi:hypothetical protein